MWKCAACEEENPTGAATCKGCLVPNPAAGPTSFSFAASTAPPQQTWTCQCCSAKNAEGALTCSSCKVRRAAEAPAAAPAPANKAKPKQQQKQQKQPEVVVGAPPAAKPAAAAAASSSWKCTVCLSPNTAAAAKCNVCGIDRSAAPAVPVDAASSSFALAPPKTSPAFTSPAAPGSSSWFALPGAAVLLVSDRHKRAAERYFRCPLLSSLVVLLTGRGQEPRPPCCCALASHAHREELHVGRRVRWFLQRRDVQRDAQARP